MKKQRGVILIITLAMVPIILFMAITAWNQSNTSLNLQRLQSSLALADYGSEAARGWAEMQLLSGITIPVQADTRNADGGAASMTWAGGAAVTFQAASVSGATAYGSAVTNPMSGSQVGYSAYVIKRGPPTEIFALGALGSNRNAITAVREIHVQIMPRAYSQYTSFTDDPAEIVQLTDKSRDRITNALLSRVCAPPCSGDTTINAGSTLSMPAAHSLSFDKIYQAAPLQIYLQTNNELTGLQNAEYHIQQPDSLAVTVVKNNIYLPSGGASGLFDCGAVVSCSSSTNIGLPSATQLDNMMQTTFTQAKNGGLLITDPNDAKLSSATNWTPGVNWDPATTTTKLEVNFKSDGWSGCSSGSGDMKLTNYLGTALNYTLNGGSSTIPAYGNVCVSSSSMTSRSVYVSGNFDIQADPAKGYAGQYTVAGPGKINMDGNLASKSFIANNAWNFFTSNPGTFTSSPGDVSSLLTPYQISMSPGNPEGFKSSMALMQIGTPYINSGNPGNLPCAWLNTCTTGSPPASLTNSNNFTVLYTGNTSTTYNKIFLYGTQVTYHRTGNWYNTFRNVYQPFDINLLTTGPPLNPILSAGYDVVGWHEVNRVSGVDLMFSKP